MERSHQPLRAISPSKDNIFKVCVYMHSMHSFRFFTQQLPFLIHELCEFVAGGIYMAMVLCNKHDYMVRAFWKNFSSGTPSAHELVPPLV
jgi:hypothetical protein